MTDGILLLPYVRALEGRHRQARTGLGLSEVVAGALLDQGGASGTGEGKGDTTEEEKVWLHCVVGARVEPQSEDADGSEEDEWVDAEDGEPSVSLRSSRLDAILPVSRSYLLLGSSVRADDSTSKTRVRRVA